MNRIILFPIIVIFSFMLNGCAAEALLGEGMRAIVEAGMDKDKCWLYQPNSYDLPKHKLDKTASVLPFSDERKNYYVNHFLRCWVPLLLYCTNECEPPEFCPNINVYRPGSVDRGINFDPKEDFAKALTEELQAAGIFREVVFGANALKSDYIISGTILDTTLKDTVYTYGFIGFGMFFWAVGLPAGSFTNDLSVEITCAETKTGHIVFSRIYTAPEYRKIFWLYALPNGCNYAEMTQAIYKQFVEALRARLQI